MYDCSSPVISYDFLPDIELIAAMRCLGCTIGAKAERPGLQRALEMARSGDVLVVWRLDRHISQEIPQKVLTNHLPNTDPALKMIRQDPKHKSKRESCRGCERARFGRVRAEERRGRGLAFNL